ncbi:hypothetical protein [Nocardia sp. NPDC004123]
MITRATNGIGKEIARGLAARRARLTLIARNPQKESTLVVTCGLGCGWQQSTPC